MRQPNENVLDDGGLAFHPLEFFGLPLNGKIDSNYGGTQILSRIRVLGNNSRTNQQCQIGNVNTYVPVSKAMLTSKHDWLRLKDSNDL